MKKYILILLLILLSFNIHAQRMFSHDKSYDIFYNYTNWGIQLDALTYFPANLSGEQTNSYKTQYGIGWKAGLVYNLNFSNHFAFRLGALAGQVPAFNTYFILQKNDIKTTDDYYHRKGARYSPINFSIPLLFEYRNFSIDRYIMSFDAGVQIERTSSANITETYKNFYFTNINNSGSWDFDLVLKAGWYYQFKPIMMQTSIVYKYRFNNQYEGIYAFTNLQDNNHNSTGKIIQKGNYLGISFNFYFRNNNREVAAGCRANTQSSQVIKRQKAKERAKRKIKKRQDKIQRKKAKKLRKKSKKWWFW